MLAVRREKSTGVLRWVSPGPAAGRGGVTPAAALVAWALTLGTVLLSVGGARAVAISEVFLPAGGLAGIEVTGVGADGAVLLRLDARRGQRWAIVDHIDLAGRSSGDGSAVDLVVEGGVSALSAWTRGGVLPADTRVTDAAAGSLGLHAATGGWAVLDGGDRPRLTTHLGDAGAAYQFSPGSPIADWVMWAPGVNEAEAMSWLEPLSASAAEVLGVTGMSRPVAATGTGTQAAEVLLRPMTAEGFARDQLWSLRSGARLGVGGGVLQVTPGAANPPVSALPEPTTVFWLGGVALAAWGRGRGLGRGVVSARES